MTRRAAPPAPDSPGLAPGYWASRLAKGAVLFASVFVFWLLVAWPFAAEGGAVRWGDAVAGLAVALLVTLLMRELVTRDCARVLSPTRYFWASVYLGVFAYYVIRGNLDVAYRVLHPALPIRPGIVRARTRLQSASARTALANCITLTPGTLTVDMTDDGTLYVHWVNVTTEEDEQVAQRILRRFEWFILRIFECP